MQRKLGMVLFLMLSACGSKASEGEVTENNAEGNNAEGNNDTATVTYHGEVRAIIERRCVGCHQAGEVGPFTLTYDPAEWSAGPAWWAQSAALSVESGTMPPWQAAEDCREIEGKRSMPASEKAIIAAWAAGGFVEGEEATYAAPGEDDREPALPEFDLVLGAGEAYTPDIDSPDDYRCLVLDHTFEEDTFITGSRVLPGDTQTVHHVLIYEIAPDDVSGVLARDEREAGVGYTCFGGTGGTGGPVAGWVPGSVPQIYPEGSAIFVEAGTKLVMQMHYNTINSDAASPDETKVGFWTLPAGQTPEREVVVAAFPNTNIQIPAGDPEATHVRGFDLPPGIRIIGAAPHMHTLGTSIRSEIQHAGGETSCIVDIPEWDFNWQQFYQFNPDKFVTTQAGDVHRVTCVHDNSAANQPVVNGEQVEPRDVRWGEGTFDEMCLNYLVLDFPFEDEGEVQCGDWAGCVEACGEEDTACYLGCLNREGAACQQCLIEETTQCAIEVCPAELQAIGQCLEECEGGLQQCLITDCAEEMDALYICERPALLSGQCNDALDACAVEF